MGSIPTAPPVQDRAAGIPLVAPDQAPLLARPYYEAGDPGPLVAALAHVPELLEVCEPFLGVVYGTTALPARTKELVVLRTSALLGCSYCVDAHTVVALDTGLSGAEVRSLRGDGAPVPAAFRDPAEAVLLDWVDAVAGGTGPVERRRREALQAHWATPEVVEITMVVSATLMLNRFCTALSLPTSAATRLRLDEAGMP